MPYHTPTHQNYDSGEFERLMDKCLALADWAGFEKRRKESEKRGKLRGRAVTPYIELAGVFNERMELRFDASGMVTIIAGTHSHGQGHATAFSQLVAEWLGVPFENINFIQGDTDKVAFGRGTFAARSSMVGGNALRAAADAVIARGKEMAAALMEASAADIEFKSGTYTVVGTDKHMSISDVARAFFAPAGPVVKLGLGLDGIGSYAGVPGGAPNYPNGCQVCEVEVDPETGSVVLDRLAAVDDLGMVINPMIVEGQIHGGLAQGIGQALFENVVYEEVFGPADNRQFSRLRYAARDRLPVFSLRTGGDTGQDESAWHQRYCRVWNDRRASNGSQCCYRRSEFAWRGPHRYAAHLGAGVAGGVKPTTLLAKRSAMIKPPPLIREHQIPTNDSKPYIAVEGPDQNLWFCESGASKIGCLEPNSGTFQEFALPSKESTPIGIDVGGDGNIWFTEKTGNRVGRLDRNGTITEFPLRTAKSGPDGIARGPDGNVWFSASDIDRVCRVTPNGNITEFGNGITPGSKPLSIVVHDGALWFSEASGGRVGRMTLEGDVTEFPIPSANSQPRAMARHPEGTIWFVETGANALGRISRGGAIVEFPVPTPNASLRGVTVARDGDLWFTENFANKIGRMAPDGTVIGEYHIPTSASGPRCITAMSDGRLFFTQYDAGLIGEIIPQ